MYFWCVHKRRWNGRKDKVLSVKAESSAGSPFEGGGSEEAHCVGKGDDDSGGDRPAWDQPEFLNRLDEIIMFKPLTKDNIGNIIHLLMNQLNKRLEDREISVELTPAAENFIVEHGYDPIYGARPLKRFLQKHVETLSAKLILADEVHANDVILIDVDGDHLTARVK